MAEWTAAEINDLPDSSFLYIEPGGSKDEDGKTSPRSLRHFPFKDAGGKVDLPHLRNALARIPQSDVSAEKKSELTAHAQKILEGENADCSTRPDSSWERVQRLDLASGELGEHRTTPQGGLVARANLTRTGVFEYRQPNGSVRRELRHPDEVFNADSLASLAHAPLTDDHPGRVTPDNWRAESIGHVAGKPHRAGKFVQSDIHIQHGPAIDKAKAGKLQELSCGYECHLDPTPGEYDGEHYDGVQRNIRYNHVALGPKGWGRAGPEVRMRLDSGVSVSGGEALNEDAKAPSYVAGMTPEEKAAFDKAQADAKAATEAAEKARKDAADAKAASDAELAKTRAENDVLKSQNAKLTDAGTRADADAKRQAEREADIQETVELRADAAKIFADDAGWKPSGKGNDQIRREAIAKMAPDFKLDSHLAPLKDNAAAQSAVIRTTYDTIKSYWEKVQGANEQLGRALNVDGKPKDEDEEETPEDARQKMIDRRKDRFKTKSDKNRDGGKGRK